MSLYIETERLILREILPTDAAGMFQLDSDPKVHQYLGNAPVKTLAEIHTVIDFIRQQYLDNGIGRCAVIEKESRKFIAWSGLKLIRDQLNGHQNFYDLGYRLIPSYWGKGYATEAARASVKYGFETLDLTHIYAITDIGNSNSKQVLAKIGFESKSIFDYDGLPHNWLELHKDNC
jgi:ribosomal-protein-alanine N-acetyltransferase